MPRPGDPALWVALVLALGTVPGCSSPKPQTVDVGRHGVQFLLPRGWERLDHGRQQLFRKGESQFSLVDLGPGTREAVVRELREAKSLWLEGRHEDAFQRVRQLRNPALRFASSRQRADFWKPWTDATYIPESADSSAFNALIAGTGLLPEITPEHMLEYVLALTSDTRRRAIGYRNQREIHGAEWMVVETWDRVSHLDRSRTAFLANDGYLLVLAIDRGRFEDTNPAFEALLTSLEVAPRAPGMR